MDVRVNGAAKGDLLQNEADRKIEQKGFDARRQLRCRENQRLLVHHHLRQKSCAHDGATDGACRGQTKQERLSGLPGEMAQAERGAKSTGDATDQPKNFRHKRRPII